MEAAIAARMLAASGIDEDDSEDVEEAANDAAALEYGFAMRHGAAAPTLTVSRLDRTAQLPAIVEDAPSPADPFVVWSAALRGDAATLESALRAAPQDVHWVGTRGWSALYAACARGHTDAVAALLRHGADPEVAVSSTGWTALMAAASYGSVDTVRALLESGADTSRANAKGQTAIDLAGAKAAHPTLHELLLAPPTAAGSAGRIQTATCEGSSSSSSSSGGAVVGSANSLVQLLEANDQANDQANEEANEGGRGGGSGGSSHVAAAPHAVAAGPQPAASAAALPAPALAPSSTPQPAAAHPAAAAAQPATASAHPATPDPATATMLTMLTQLQADIAKVNERVSALPLDPVGGAPTPTGSDMEGTPIHSQKRWLSHAEGSEGGSSPGGAAGVAPVPATPASPEKLDEFMHKVDVLTAELGEFKMRSERAEAEAAGLRGQMASMIEEVVPAVRAPSHCPWCHAACPPHPILPWCHVAGSCTREPGERVAAHAADGREGWFWRDGGDAPSAGQGALVGGNVCSCGHEWRRGGLARRIRCLPLSHHHPRPRSHHHPQPRRFECTSV